MHRMTTWLATCSSCGKRTYADRKTARHAAKADFPAGGKCEYRCPDTGLWHIGATHVMVREGLAART